MDHHGDIGVFVLGDHKVDTIPVASSINLNRLTLTRLEERQFYIVTTINLDDVRRSTVV